jgi:prepilin-type N-terminal cleavage/methylation domain-containing protein
MNSYKAHMKKETRQTGFTLVELLVTVVVLLVTLLIGIPSFNRLIEQRQLNDVTQTLISYIYQARSESVARSEIVYLGVEADTVAGENGIAIGVFTDDDCQEASGTDCDCDPTTGGASCDIASIVGGNDVLGAAFRLTEDDDIIQFNPFDSSTSMADYVLSVDDGTPRTEGDACKRITVGYLGQINVTTGHLDALGTTCQ